MPQFPFLTLLVSGGHTLLLLATSLSSFRVLATTCDESIGRAFDKVSRMLELAWTDRGPGAALEQFCAGGESEEQIDIPTAPRPMHSRLAFSYAGLHSFVQRFICSHGGIENLDLKTRRALAREFQTAAITQLEEKLTLGLKWCTQMDIKIRHVVVSGGVASNSFMRERLQKWTMSTNTDEPVSLNFPPPDLCIDNAVMIAWASMYRFQANDHDDYSISLRAKWNIDGT